MTSFAAWRTSAKQHLKSDRVGPIPRTGKNKNKKAQKQYQEITSAIFAAEAVEPHTTKSGFLFFDIQNVSSRVDRAARLPHRHTRRERKRADVFRYSGDSVECGRKRRAVDSLRVSRCPAGHGSARPSRHARSPSQLLRSSHLHCPGADAVQQVGITRIIADRSRRSVPPSGSTAGHRAASAAFSSHSNASSVSPIPRYSMTHDMGATYICFAAAFKCSSNASARSLVCRLRRSTIPAARASADSARQVRRLSAARRWPARIRSSAPGSEPPRCALRCRWGRARARGWTWRNGAVVIAAIVIDARQVNVGGNGKRIAGQRQPDLLLGLIEPAGLHQQQVVVHVRDRAGQA